MTNPTTDSDEIIETLRNLEVGDEVTVQTEYGLKINRKVRNITDINNHRDILLGDPTGTHLYVSIYPRSTPSAFVVESFVFTDSVKSPRVRKGTVQKLWIWDND